MSKLTKRLTAMLLSGMLVIGSVPGAVFASEMDADQGQTSEVAVEEVTSVEVTEESTDPAVEESVDAAVEETEETSVDATAEEAAVEYYTVTLDANGGFFANEWDDSIGETVESTEILNKNIPIGEAVDTIPVREQENVVVTFMGWSLERDGETVPQEYIPVENCVLYAVWSIEENTTDESNDSEETIDPETVVDEEPNTESETYTGTDAERSTNNENETTEVIDENDEMSSTEIIIGQEQDEVDSIKDEAENNEDEPDNQAVENREEVSFEDTIEPDSSDTASEEIVDDENKEISQHESVSHGDDHTNDEKNDTISRDRENLSGDSLINDGKNREEKDDVASESSKEEVSSERAANSASFEQTEYNGHKYQLFNEGVSWSTAQTRCEEKGGHLVTVTSAEEHAFCKSLLGDLSPKYCWIGATHASGSWKWITGESWEYTAWGTYPLAQPNGSGGGTYALMENFQGCGSPWSWDDQGDSGTSPDSTYQGSPYYHTTENYCYICEWEQESNVSLSIEGPLTAEDGDDFTIYATYSEGERPEISQIKWSSTPEEALTFSNVRIENYNNYYRILADVDVLFPGNGKKQGIYTANVSVAVGNIKDTKTFNINAQSVYKAEKNAFPFCNNYEGYDYEDNYIIPLKRYYQAMSGNPISFAITTLYGPIGRGVAQLYGSLADSGWGGNCFALALLSAANFEGKIDLKKKYFSDKSGSVLTKYGWHNKSGDDSYYYLNSDSEIVRLIEQVQLSQSSAQTWNCRVFKKDSDYRELINKLEDGNGKPYVVKLVYDHAVVIDPSKPVVRDSDGKVRVHIYDPNQPYAGYQLRNPRSYYYQNDSNQYAYLLLNTNNGEAQIVEPNSDGSETTYIPQEPTSRKNVEIYDISKLNKDYFNGATWVGFTRGNLIGDNIDVCWDSENNISFTPTGIFSSDNNINCGFYTYTNEVENTSLSGNETKMYYFDLPSNNISYVSNKSLLSIFNDSYAPYKIYNEGKTSFDVDFEKEELITKALENNARISITTSFENENDGICVECTLQSQESIRTINDSRNNSFTVETSNDSIIDIFMESPESSTDRIHIKADIPANQAIIVIKDSDNIKLNATVDINCTTCLMHLDETETNARDIVVLQDKTMEVDVVVNSNPIASGTCGDNLTWTLTEGGTLRITGTGGMNSYFNDTTFARAPWYSNLGSIKSIAIGNGVTNIGFGAFEGCSNLKSVTIPNSVTTIKGSAFKNCDNLTNVTIPNSVTSIDAYVFSDCSNLKRVTIPISVTSIGSGAFSNCSSLTSITIPDSVTSIGDWTFNKCSSLSSVTIPDNVTDIGNGAFFSCNSLTNITIPNSVASIGDNAFSFCSSLTCVTIPNSVTSIGNNAFSFCSSLTSVTIPDNVTTIGNNVFIACSDKFVIYGVPGSSAEQYAIKNNITFININAKSINSASITITAQTYNGKPQTPDPVIKVDSTTLKSGTDYEVSYLNNTNAGTAVMKITGKGNYTGSVSKNFTINKAAQSITASNLTLTFPKTGTITASGNKGKLTYKSSNTAVAAIDSTGKVTSKGAGTAKITITAAATDNYNSATKTITVTINKAAQSITAKAKASSVAVGKTTTVSITGAKGKKSYKSSNTSLATVSSAGKVTAKKVGTVTITATSGATANYKAASKKITIKIIPKSTTISSLSPAKGAITVKWKKQASQTSGYQIQYSSKSDFKTQKTVTVSGAGKVSKKISGLAKKHKYYVRIRTYKTVGGKKYFSTWSSAKSVKTK